MPQPESPQPTAAENERDLKLEAYSQAVIGAAKTLTGRYPGLEAEIKEGTYVWSGMNLGAAATVKEIPRLHGNMSLKPHAVLCIYRKSADYEGLGLKLPVLWVKTNGLLSRLTDSCHLFYSDDGGATITSRCFSARRGWRPMTAGSARRLFRSKLLPLQEAGQVFPVNSRRKSAALELWRASMAALEEDR